MRRGEMAQCGVRSTVILAGNERMGEHRRHKAAFHAKNERQRPFSKPICRQAS